MPLIITANVTEVVGFMAELSDPCVSYAVIAPTFTTPFRHVPCLAYPWVVKVGATTIWFGPTTYTYVMTMAHTHVR